MEEIATVCLMPFVILLCIAAVQALRRHWQTSAIALLGCVSCLLLYAVLMQSHHNVILRAILRMQRTQIEKLTAENEEIRKGSSNQASQAIGAEAAPHPER
jgi:hypothetical protein